MKEINRFYIMGNKLPSDDGSIVSYKDHAAIVAGKDAHIAALQEQLSRHSMSAGQADQRKSESDAVRVALGFSADADDVSPSNLVDAIAGLQEQVRSLAAECKAVYAHALEEGYQFYPGGIEYTDAVLREIRAQAVDEFSEYCRGKTESRTFWMDVSSAAEEYAARIRAGEKL